MRNLIAFIFILPALLATAQADLHYFMPEGVSFNPSIPTPASIIGHEVGEWHVTHDRLVNYMMAIDRASDRITLEQTGSTFEGRPLLLLTITSPENHRNIESIRIEHLKLSDPSATTETRNMPAVFYMGFSIHGNEPSGSNASLLVAYYLAAALGQEIDQYLANTVILFDPSFNPDGLQRFAAWANSRKSRLMSADPNDMEHNEAWPGGRTNHYWFDLNRDWMVGQMPESQARIKKYHQWRPNVLTDHHEMGTNSTFFFQPGVPARMHPLTPAKNLELTKKIGEYHARALDKIGSLYFTQQGYDDFYYGKGSTFPDLHGGIGILFEQASSRGHEQESVNGVLRFPFTIRNQFTCALSTLKAVNEMRIELLNYQQDCYKTASTDAAKDPVKVYAFSGGADKMKSFLFAEMLMRQRIEIYHPSSQLTVNGQAASSEATFIVPLNQPQYRLIKAMFEKRTKFTDSLFYDISSWTLPHAFGLEFEELKASPAGSEKVTELKMPTGKITGDTDYAFVFEGYGYYAPRAMYRLLNSGIRIKVASEPFYHSSGKKFERGSILIPLENQDKTPAQIKVYLREIAARDGLDVYAFNSGLDYQGVSMGSGSFLSVKKPEIAMLVEGGVSANDAGEIWHLLDQRMNMPVTCMPLSILTSANINRYNVLIFPTGNYASINDATKEKLKTWVQNGGVIIGFEAALTWFNSSGLGKFEMKPGSSGGGPPGPVASTLPPDKDEKKVPVKPKPYSDIDETTGAQETSGAIFEVEADITNPLLYGYTRNRLPLFKANNLFLEKGKGAFSNPLTYGSSPLLSGYISKQNYEKLKQTSALGVSVLGRGRVIGFTEDMCFRAFWLGTNKMLMNSVFYGGLLSTESGR